jgi:hypothetical protein
MIPKALALVPAFTLLALSALADDCPDFTGTYSTVDPQGRDIRVQLERYTCERLGRLYIYDEHEFRMDIQTDGIIRQFNQNLPAISWALYTDEVTLLSQTVWFEEIPDGDGQVMHGRVSTLQLTDAGDLIETVQEIDADGNGTGQTQYLYIRESER